MNRRTRATLEDNSWWQYAYNDRNELTAASRHWYDASFVSGQQYGYAYDNIGNRQTASFGGDAGGNHLQTISYTANNLNQYTGIVTPGQKDICGAALATNAVTVNGGLADRHGEYFHRQISVANTNQPVWQPVATGAGAFTNQGGLVFPANNQTLTYDADGNLTFDGVWNYQWDGENRLISMNMTNVANIANANRLRLDFAYDFMGRRMQKVVSTWNGSAFANPVTNLFVYDGWNLLAVLNPQQSVLQSFVWGNDLSGTMTRAGGVGGLLMSSLSGTNCFTAFDGNGNITALINAADKSTAARYEYSPCHELLRATGPSAHLNPFRSSTKYWDDESGLVYYGRRYYVPIWGKWASRDPIGENGGINLTLFALNAAVQRIDSDGGTVVTIASEPVYSTGDWAGATTMGKLFPETFGRWEADLEEAGYSSKYARGIEWGSQEEMAAQRAELVAGETMSAVGKALFAVSVGAQIIGSYQAINNGAATDFVNNAADYYKHTMNGDSAWADLDVICMATSMMEMTDRYESAYVLIDILYQ